MANANPLFDQIDNLWNKSEKVTSETKAESIYMTCRFLSMSQSGFLASMDVNQTIGAPEWAKLPFLYHAIPKQGRPYSSYPKATKEKLTPKRQKAIERICAKFCVKPYHALQIIALLEKQGVKVEAD